MSALPINLPVAPSRSRYVEILPDDRFFVRTVPLLTGDDAGPVREQIELALESLAPFPVSQLYWGYWTRPGSDRALVYAAYQKRFTLDETDLWADAEWVAPRFATLLAGNAPAPATTWIMRGGEGLTALHFDDDSGIPVMVQTRLLSDEATEREVDAVREELIKACGGSRTVEDISAVEVDAGKPGDDELVINRDGSRHELELDDAVQLDVRDPAELTSRRRARVRDTWLWRLTIAAVVLLLFSGIGELALMGLDYAQQGRMKQIAAQTPVVSEIETAHRLAHRIEELHTRRLRPFEMIALVDQPRPENIVFRRTTATGLFTLEIEAETDNAAAINTYITELNGMGGTSNVEMLNLETRGDRSTLRLRVTFTPDAFDNLAASLAANQGASS